MVMGNSVADSPPSITLRQLRNTKQILAWMRAGVIVELRDRGRVLGHMVPARSYIDATALPSFEERYLKIFGRTASTAE